MGKGDRRSRRGKLFRGTFGKSRKHKGPSIAPPSAPAPKAATPVEVKPEAPKKKRAPKKKVAE